MLHPSMLRFLAILIISVSCLSGLLFLLDKDEAGGTVLFVAAAGVGMILAFCPVWVNYRPTNRDD